jgi:hypothetical protein
VFEVVVQSPATPRACWPTTRASIEASDIGTRYRVLTNPAIVPAHLHLIGVLEELAWSPAPWALRLEDDCLVNRHVLANLASWPGLTSCDMGRLFVAAKPETPWRGSVAVLFRVRALPRLIWAIKKIAALDVTRSQDKLLHLASIKTECAVLDHDSPPLVEHLWEVPSTEALRWPHTRESASTCGRWTVDWLRP